MVSALAIRPTPTSVYSVCSVVHNTSQPVTTTEYTDGTEWCPRMPFALLLLLCILCVPWFIPFTKQIYEFPLSVHG